MTDATVDSILAALPGIVRQAVAEALAAQRSALTPRQQRVVLALHNVFGDMPFTSAAVVDSLTARLQTRSELRQALQACAGSDYLTPQRVGHALRAIADAGGTVGKLRLVAAGSESGSRRWVIEGASGR